MDWFFAFAAEHAAYAHWVLFGSLILAGLNLPISEDLVLMVGGVMASTVDDASALKLFLFIFMGAYLSDWMVYWIGRLLGPRLWRLSWFRKTVSRKRFDQVERHYEKYGAVTLLVGRFIPFGVRNCLFTVAGMVRMPWLKFMLVDGIACLASNSFFFWLFYIFGKNYEQLASYIEVFDIVAFVLFALAIIGFVWYKKSKKARST